MFFPCFAQNDAVVVTATRFPEDVRRLPASTTVLSADDIERSAARTLPELLQEQVGFNMRDLFGNNAAQTTIDLRGYGATGAQNTLILLDGRRQNDFDLSGVQWASIPLPMIERIEILRGTGAVLYGDDASAGVVNIVTRSPLKQGNLFEAMGRVGSYETVEGQLYGSYATDRFGVNALVYGYDSDGYRANNRNEQQNTAVNLRWALGEGALDLRFGIDQQDLRLPGARRMQPSIGLDEYQSDPRGAQTPLDYASRDGTRAGMTSRSASATPSCPSAPDYRDKDQRSYFDQGGFPTTARTTSSQLGHAAAAAAVLDRRRAPQPHARRRLERLGLRLAPHQPAGERRAADQPRRRLRRTARASTCRTRSSSPRDASPRSAGAASG